MAGDNTIVDPDVAEFVKRCGDIEIVKREEIKICDDTVVFSVVNCVLYLPSGELRVRTAYEWHLKYRLGSGGATAQMDKTFKEYKRDVLNYLRKH